MTATITFGLVTEGVTDVETVQVLVREYLRPIGIESSFKRLQPALDATTRGYTQGGWSHLMAWCASHPRNERESLFLQPIFKDVDAICDVILVQMDGDIIQCIASQHTIPITPVTDSLSMFAAVETVLSSWLWPSGPRSPQEVTVPAIQSTESWIIAGARPDISSPEDEDPVPLLIALDKNLEDPGRCGKLVKNSAQWVMLAHAHVQGNVNNITARCPLLLTSLGSVKKAAKAYATP
mgnify:CR=1 FL=1